MAQPGMQAPYMAQASTMSSLAVLVLRLVVNFNTMIGAIGSGAIIVALVLILASLASGYGLGQQQPLVR